jgi:hypothetical protein
VALLEVDAAPWLLDCGAGSAGVSAFGAANTAGAKINANTATICFIASLQKIGVSSRQY